MCSLLERTGTGSDAHPICCFVTVIRWLVYGCSTLLGRALVHVYTPVWGVYVVGYRPYSVVMTTNRVTISTAPRITAPYYEVRFTSAGWAVPAPVLSADYLAAADRYRHADAPVVMVSHYSHRVTYANAAALAAGVEHGQIVKGL